MILYHDSKIQGNLIGVRSDRLKNTWSIECIVKLGFRGVYIIFLISAQNIDCVYTLEPPRRRGSNGYPQTIF